MTRKDYIAAASRIADYRAPYNIEVSTPEQGNIDASDVIRGEIADTLVYIFAADNVRFNPHTFYTACNLKGR